MERGSSAAPSDKTDARVSRRSGGPGRPVATLSRSAAAASVRLSDTDGDIDLSRANASASDAAAPDGADVEVCFGACAQICVLNENVKVLPTPSVESTATRPPSSRARCCVMDSPSPLEPDSVEVPSSARKKRVNSWPSLAAGTPLPVSFTAMCTHSHRKRPLVDTVRSWRGVDPPPALSVLTMPRGGSPPTATEISKPPSSVYLIALLTKLTTI
mmetsp:Transcript_27588/g.95385  ORF Transcript_27588/g.95385 Transcript_27588/m.95385 type:complete len:215 (-) Transcript_27588:1606-2250(-)